MLLIKMVNSSSSHQTALLKLKESIKPNLRITSNMQIVCELLQINLINYGQVTYPSLLSLYNQVSEKMCLMTFKQTIKKLVELQIIEKLPRTKTQPLAVNVNNCPLRFILAIHQTVINFTKQIQYRLSKKIDDYYLQQLVTSRMRLETLIDRLTNKHETVQELCEFFLTEFPVTIVSECSSDELDARMRESIEWFVGEEHLSLSNQIEELLSTKEEDEDDGNL